MNERNHNPSFRPGKILIVEDETLVAWDIEQTLKDLGFVDVDNVTTLAAARAALEQTSVALALAIVDIKLGDGDGSDLIADFQSRCVPVLVVTGYGHFKHPDVRVLLKPYSVAELTQNVLQLVGCRGLI
jgi:DNA-binding NtrC family response regulator